ncbi:MAG: DUF2520 domain-containing protein [Pseudobdellovibrio sp.]|nr:DUF2520 domain-containing protein [Pseudobdellovibrio sp.]
MKTNNSRDVASNILIIGNGRLAKHLIHWCTLLQQSVHHWHKHDNKALSLQNIDYVWLAISDNALVPFYQETLKPLLSGQKIVHFSGSLHHSDMISAHPLMTFSHKLYDLETYNKIYFGLTGAESLIEALPGFTNAFFKLRAEDKPLYHALCVASGNLPQLLWSETQPQFADLKVPPEAVKVFLQQSLTNFFSQGAQAVTGPIVRKDTTTITKNLSALEKVSLKLKNIYQSFLQG